MIQRIQSVYLLIVTALIVTAMCLPLGYFTNAAGEQWAFRPCNTSTWGLMAILFVCAVVALGTIFLFRNRVLQMRLTVFNSLLLVGYYCAAAAFYFAADADGLSFRIHWALCLPLVSIIINYLAIRAIARDEVLVKAADRLR